MEFKNIGDNLTTNEFNDYVTLLRGNFILTENLRITSNVVNGGYSNYGFDFSGATVIDNGVLITDETLSANNTVRLVNPAFHHATYRLLFKVMSITDYNLYLEDKANYISYETLTVTLNNDEDEVEIDLSGFEKGNVLLFDVEIEIKQDIPRIIEGEPQHIYVLAFSQSSYIARGGSALVSCTLTDNGVPVSGATVSVVGSDSSLYTGITNNDGIAQVTVSNISGTVSFTCTYSNVSDVCTVTAQSYLFYDACNTTYDDSKYGSIIALSTSTQTNYTSYVSSENAYHVRADGDWGLLPIPAMDNQDNYKISAYFKPVGSTTHLYRGGFGFITEGTKYPFYHVRLQGNKRFTYARFQSGNEYDKQDTANINITDYHRIEVIKQGNNYTFNLYDFDDTTIIVTYSKTFSLSENVKMGLYLCCGSSYGCYVKEIKAESL